MMLSTVKKASRTRLRLSHNCARFVRLTSVVWLKGVPVMAINSGTKKAKVTASTATYPAKAANIDAFLAVLQKTAKVATNNNSVSGWIGFQKACALSPYGPWNIESDCGGAIVHRGTTAKCS